MFDPSNIHGLPERLRAAFGADGAQEIARRSGVSLGTVQSILTSTLPRADTLAQLAAAAGVSLDWLITGMDAEPTGARPVALINVPRYDVALSAGPGSFVDRADKLGSVPFPQEFFTDSLRRNPAGMVIVDARGDSMEPTIADGNQVMIDTADMRILPAIWAFMLDDAVLVKRLQQTPAGIQVASDKPAYAPFTIDRADADSFHLIGRVVWVGRVL